jgi:hypothetical protein
MLDHTGLLLAQHKQDLLQKLLAPLGITILMEPRGKAAGFGQDGRAILLDRGSPASCCLRSGRRD